MICRTRYVISCYESFPLSNSQSTSPELVQVHQGKRDYSVYVLDPLEARAPVPSLPSGSRSSTHGVATGLGLMSMAMNDPECDISVTGTISTDGIQEERLEVIFALREVCARANLFLCPSNLSSTVSIPGRCRNRENIHKPVAAKSH